MIHRSKAFYEAKAKVGTVKYPKGDRCKNEQGEMREVSVGDARMERCCSAWTVAERGTSRMFGVKKTNQCGSTNDE